MDAGRLVRPALHRLDDENVLRCQVVQLDAGVGDVRDVDVGAVEPCAADLGGAVHERVRGAAESPETDGAHCGEVGAVRHAGEVDLDVVAQHLDRIGAGSGLVSRQASQGVHGSAPRLGSPLFTRLPSAGSTRDRQETR
jgi:hypothetical protein